MFKRNGLQTFAKIVHSLCRLLGVFRGSINTAIDASSIQATDKARLKDLIQAVDTTCSAIDVIMTRWE